MAERFERGTGRFAGHTRGNPVVEEGCGPPVILAECDAVPRLLMLRNGLVPTPVLDEAGRCAQHVEASAESGDGLGDREGETLWPRTQNVVVDPVLVQPAHARQGSEVGTEERDEFL